jgi:hypothetical protein
LLDTFPGDHENIEAEPIAKCDPPQLEEEILPLIVADASIVLIATVPRLQDRHSRSSGHVPDLERLRMRGMCHRIRHEFHKIGMSDERARLIEDHGRSVLARPLRVNKIAEIVQLEVSGENALDPSLERGADGDHRCADGERKMGRGDQGPFGLYRVVVPEALARIVTILS